MAKATKENVVKITDPESDEQSSVNSEPLQTLIIEDVKYKTRYNKKFTNRKLYEPKDPKKIISFIPGTIKKVYLSKGKRVKVGDKLLDLEAMKMVNTIFCEYNGTIADLYVKEGDQVPKNFLLAVYK